MSRTHHAICSFRLSCGCVTSFNSFPEAKKPTVLCGNCRESATIEFRYPDSGIACGVTCRADLPDGGNTRVLCGRDKGHKTRHYDPSVDLEFDLPERLKSRRTGNT